MCLFYVFNSKEENGYLAENVPNVCGISRSPDKKACGEYNLSGVS